MTNLLLFLGLLLPLRPLLVPWLTSHVLLCFALTAFSCYYLILYVQTDCESLEACSQLVEPYQAYNPRPYLISDAKSGLNTYSADSPYHDSDQDRIGCSGSRQTACTVLLGYSSSIVVAIILLTYLIYLVQVREYIFF